MTSIGPTLQRDRLLDFTITGLAFGGKGVARVDGFVVFVGGAVPGDVVRARVLKNKKRYAEARVEQLLTPSADRISARCPSFGACGGCVWQDLDYEAQLGYKAGQVRESLEHLGGLRDFELRPIVGMDSPWRYRNRADFSIGTAADGPVVGFRPRGSWDAVLPLSECHLLEPGIEAARATVQDWLREGDLAGWDPRSGSGFARHLLARSSQNGKELLVSLVTAARDLPQAENLVARLREAHPQLVGLVHAVNPGKAELSAGLPFTTLWGRPFLLEKIAGLTLKVSLDAFFQTNTVMAERLYGLVAQAMGLAAAATDAGTRESLAPAKVLWDLYSGVGSIGLSLAPRAKAVLGIEAAAPAVADARENALLNSLENVHFVEGDVAMVLREVTDGVRALPAGLDAPDVIVLDPPRAGLSNKAASRIGEIGAPAIVHVSCNPSTLAPNVAQLREYGYRLEQVTPVDMFPHTPHVECMALLSRGST
jgi:23S rRNA (uracil1939-C5)-methyltransferase